MPIYCGVDFHARQQTICYYDTTDGALHRIVLDHKKDDVGGFYYMVTVQLVEASSVV